MSNTNFSPYIRQLRKLGFTKHWDSRSKVNGRQTEYIRERDGRTVNVQLWSDGGHRASHMIAGYMNTRPTSFRDISGMIAAIETEQTRMDNRKAQSS